MSESFRFCSRAVVESFHRAENFSVHQTQDRHPEKFVEHASNVNDVIRRRRRTQVRECDGVAPWRGSNVSLSAVGKFILIQFQCSNRVIRINGSVATWFFYLWAHVWCDWRSRLLITRQYIQDPRQPSLFQNAVAFLLPIRPKSLLA